MKTIPFWKLSEDILELHRADQEMRERALRNPRFWNHKIDTRTANFISVMIPALGWPTRTMIGVRAADALGLLVRHVDHVIRLQEQCLSLMERIASEQPGEVNLPDIAYLADRIRVNRGLPQIYGTQFDERDGQLFLRPLENRTGVNSRRARMGLGTLAEGIAAMRKKYARFC